MTWNFHTTVFTFQSETQAFLPTLRFRLPSLLAYTKFWLKANKKKSCYYVVNKLTCNILDNILH